MKSKAFALAIACILIACTTDNQAKEIPKQVSTLKSDILLESSAIRPFSGVGEKDCVYLSLSGKTILESIATFKATNAKGEELHCETFAAKALIQPEYKTANSSLQEAHIREVVDGFFVDDLDFQKIKDDALAWL